MGKPRPREVVRQMVLSRNEACRALGVSINTIDRIVRSGKLRAKRLEGRVVIPVSEIERYIASLEDVESPPADEAGGQEVKPRAEASAPPAGERNGSPSRA